MPMSKPFNIPEGYSDPAEDRPEISKTALQNSFEKTIAEKVIDNASKTVGEQQVYDTLITLITLKQSLSDSEFSYLINMVVSPRYYQLDLIHNLSKDE